MSCNTKTSLAAVIDAVNAQLNNNYVDRDDPRINQGVFTEPTIRGGLMLDEAAKLDFCGYVDECGLQAPFGKQWVDRPLYPDDMLVSYDEGGEIKAKWQGIEEVIAASSDTTLRSDIVAGELITDIMVRTLKVQGATDAVERDQHAKNNELISVKDFGAIGDGVTPDSASIQKNIAWVETNRTPYVFIPTSTENYLLDAPLLFEEPGIKIFGQKGVSYNRGRKRNGNLLVGPLADYAIDLGNSRTYAKGGTDNPADSFTVANIGILEAPGVTKKSKDGIRITPKTDGPDRGGVIREVSAIGMNRAIYIPDPGKSVLYANLHVENCCFSEGRYSLVSEGNVLGLRFVGNQAEQNSSGTIHGTFNGHVYIADNMLEGSRNCINITIPPITGNKLKLEVTGNYFEGMSGDYVISSSHSSTDASITVRDNYLLGIGAVEDYLRISGNTVKVDMNDSAALTTVGTTTILPRGELFNNVPYFKVRELLYNVGGMIISKDYEKYTTDQESHVHTRAINGTRVPTPYGNVEAVTGTSWLPIDLAVEVNDLVCLNVLARIDKNSVGTSGMQVFDKSRANAIMNSVYPLTSRFNDGWGLVTIAFRVTKASEGIQFRFLFSGAGAQGLTQIIGIASKNYGQYVDDNISSVPIYPTCPYLDFENKAETVYEPTELAPSTQVTTVVDLANALVGDYVAVSYDKPLQGTRIWAEVTAKGKITVYHRNDTEEAVTVDAGNLSVKIL